MIEVNPFYVGALLYPLAGLADDDETVEHYRTVDPNNENAVRTIIRERLVPDFQRWDERSRAKAKLSLQYVLSFDPAWCMNLYDSLLLPFSAPDAPCLFFEWLWDELFADESYQLADKSQFVVVKDIHAPNLIKRS